MPAYVHQHKLGVCPISELDHTLNPFRDRIPLVGLGGGWAEPLGFTLMRVQIEEPETATLVVGTAECLIQANKEYY